MTAWKNIAALLGVLVLVGTGAWLLARSQYYPSWLLASEARFVPRPGQRRFRFRMMEFGRKAVLDPQTDALVRVTLKAPASRTIRWSVRFAP